MSGRRNYYRLILFQDDFGAYPPAALIRRSIHTVAPMLGSWHDYSLHYRWKSPRFSGYSDTCFPWAIGEQEGNHYLEMPDPLMNVVLAAGDELWQDYRLELKLAWTGQGSIGPLFRYRTSRHYYRLDFAEGKMLRLMRRNDEQELCLAERAFPHLPGEWHAVAIDLNGPNIHVAVDGQFIFEADDDHYASGRIGLRTHLGTGRFAAVAVSADRSAGTTLKRLRSENKRRIRQRASRYPAPVLLREINLPEPFSMMRAVDLNNDGRLEFIGIVVNVVKADHMLISRLVVMDTDGCVLWARGKPVARGVTHGDVACQVGDVNGDGTKEILFTQDYEIFIANSLTGEILQKAPTPCVKGQPVIGDSFHLCRLRGQNTRRDILFKDRYCNIWAYTDDLRLLWHRELNTGHYPRAADINGDGRDEVMAGYSLLDADGNTLWTVPDADPLKNRYPGPEHADSLWLGRFKEGPQAPMEIAIAASDLGFILLGTDGKLNARDLCGHAQSMGIAKFRRDLPGRQFAVFDFWGNPGICMLFDCNGQRLATREFYHTSLAVPVKWAFTGEALIYGYSNHCLLDGNLTTVVELPRVRKALQPYFADVDGDGLDEFLSWDDRKIQVWGRRENRGSDPVPDERDWDNFNLYGAFYM